MAKKTKYNIQFVGDTSILGKLFDDIVYECVYEKVMAQAPGIVQNGKPQLAETSDN